MIPNYSEYLEAIKKKLDAMNKASGFDPQMAKQIKHDVGMPSDDIFDMLGNGAKMWMEKQKNQNPDSF